MTVLYERAKPISLLAEAFHISEASTFEKDKRSTSVHPSMIHTSTSPMVKYCGSAANPQIALEASRVPLSYCIFVKKFLTEQCIKQQSLVRRHTSLVKQFFIISPKVSIPPVLLYHSAARQLLVGVIVTNVMSRHLPTSPFSSDSRLAGHICFCKLF